MRWHVNQVLLYLLDFVDAQPRRIRLVVHLEVFDLFESVLGLPLNTLFLFPNWWRVGLFQLLVAELVYWVAVSARAVGFWRKLGLSVDDQRGLCLSGIKRRLIRVLT
jgi:hypothetical protein